jgi:hypothetical protein
MRNPRTLDLKGKPLPLRRPYQSSSALPVTRPESQSFDECNRDFVLIEIKTDENGV